MNSMITSAFDLVEQFRDGCKCLVIVRTVCRWPAMFCDKSAMFYLVRQAKWTASCQCIYQN
jgi:hypothetical protein